MTQHRVLTSVVIGLLTTATPARATWSILAFDKQSGAIVVSGATCVAKSAYTQLNVKDLFSIQAIVVPGKGAAVEQANADPTGRNQGIIYSAIRAGERPEAIVEALKVDPNSYDRQIVVLNANGDYAAYTGPRTHDHASGVHGVVEDRMYFAIQGDFLEDATSLRKASDAFGAASGDVVERTLRAMEVVDANGGDRRCGCNYKPSVAGACTPAGSRSAYIVRVDRDAQMAENYADVHYSLFISASKFEESSAEVRPVLGLRAKYELWKKGLYASESRKE